MHEVSHRSHIQARRNNSCCWCIIMCMCNNKSNQNWTPKWKLCSWLQCTLHDRLLIPNAIGSLKSAAVKDPGLQLLKNTIYNGWPALDDGLILKADRVVVPESLCTQVLKATHTGHQGKTKCLLLARQSVFWTGISGDICQWWKMANYATNINKHNQSYQQDHGRSSDQTSSSSMVQITWQSLTIIQGSLSSDPEEYLSIHHFQPLNQFICWVWPTLCANSQFWEPVW